MKNSTKQKSNKTMVQIITQDSNNNQKNLTLLIQPN